MKSKIYEQVTVKDLNLRLRLERLATLDERKLAQMARILLKKAVDEKEEELGLPPIEDEAA
ncbi:hypothetical protein RYY30_000190 [Vibrio cholerae]|uniref:hypothetical protein n=1 Tax=Vibrio cholerae TaxID=666 RepID=UPI00019F70FA|nr:hypothetical protein [Vibrio cholerae]AOY47692.1 hypothetical protein NH62_21447 [Vibrio cholerae]AOY51294.1 hypothetical protein AP033_21443 [Vibrio cholerae]EEO05894.1 hypothetical protein VIF_002507 [Vibrio cholerae TM 11079-80]EGQ7702642.1 hypothetical protein [Vibrio cholerae]EGQ8491633.1 hypothetical protein [Vibrio cholerae]